MRRLRSPLLIAFLLGSITAGARADAPTSAKAAQARVDAAAAAYAHVEADWRSGTATLDQVCTWSERWFLAQRELPSKAKALADAADANLKRISDAQALVDQRVKAGLSGSDEAAVITYCRAEADLFDAQAHGR